MGASERRQTVEVGGRRIAFQRAGEGPPLVFLHGIGGNADQWREQLAGLADDFDVVAWDAPGYGASDDPDGAWRIGDYAQALVGLLDALGLDPVHLVGQSWGGAIAQSFAVRYPEWLRSLTLANTSIFGAQPEEQRQAGLQARLRALETMTPAEMAEARAPALLPPDPPGDLYREVIEMLAAIHPAGYRMASIALANAENESERLGRIAVPALVIAGELDQVVPLPRVEALASAIPGARLAVFDGSAHLTNQEQPERFNAVLRDFLLSAAPGSGGNARP